MKNIPQEAQELVAKWTEGLTVIATVKPFPDLIAVVAKETEDKYHVTAFFPIGGKWQVSADAQRVSADKAFEALEKRLN